MAPFTTAITFLALSSAVLASNPRYERRAVTGVPHSKSTVSAGRYPITNGTIPVAGPTGTAVQSLFTSRTTSAPVNVTTPATSLVVPATSAAVATASSPASVADAIVGTQMADGQVNVAAAAAPLTTPLVGAGAAAATTCPPCPTVVVTSCPAASAAVISSPPAPTVTVTETGPAAVTIKEMVTFTVTASLSGTEFIPTATATGNTLTSVMASKKANTVPPYPLVSSFVTVGPSGTGVGTAVGTVGTGVRAASGAPLASGTGR